jgi:hypothetical protein
VWPEYRASAGAERVVNAFFTSLVQMNIPAFMQVWGDEAQQFMPLAPVGFPQLLSGKAAIENQYKGLPENFLSMQFPWRITPTANPDVVIVSYTGRIQLKAGGEYNNIYHGVFETTHGRLQRFTEYFDAEILSHAFGQNLNTNFNVNNATTSPAPAHTAAAATILRKVEFLSEGLVLKGNLFLPAGFDQSRKYPTVIVTGSWTSIKEQMAGLYAEKLARRGFVALAFDFRFWGESEGQPRQYENPEAKIEDIRNAAAYLHTLNFVDTTALSGLGICASAGYMAYAAAQDHRIKNLVTVAAWLHNRSVAETIYNNWPEKYDGLLARSKAAAEKFSTTGQTEFVPACSDTDPNAAMYVPGGIFPYYIDTALGAIPQYTNRFAVMSWSHWLQFDGVAAGKSVQKPVFMVHSTNAALPEGAKEFYQSIPGEKQIEWLNEYNQMEFYYKDEAVNAAVNSVAAWLLN